MRPGSWKLRVCPGQSPTVDMRQGYCCCRPQSRYKTMKSMVDLLLELGGDHEPGECGGE